MKNDVDRYFVQQVLSCQQELYTYARKLTNHPQDADDLFQDAITRAYIGIKSYSLQQVQNMHLRSWLYKIMFHTFLNSKRVKNALPASQFEEDPLLSLEDNWQEQPEHVIESGESLQELNTLVGTLPERLQTPIQLFYFQNFSYLEIAQTLNQPLNTIKSYIFQGKQLLRQAILTQQEKER